MGKKTRIILLTVTAVLAVFVFSAMWAVRPGSPNAVLEAARARQSEPLLSVSEPLETDVKTLSDEERMAESVAAILADDEDFLSSLALAIADSISLDAYIPEITENVYDRISADYGKIAEDAAASVNEGLEDEILALYGKYREYLTADIVMAILSRYDEMTAAEKADVLSLDDIAVELYGRYRDDVVADIAAAVALQITDAEDIDALSEEEIRNIVTSVYEEKKEEIITDAEERIVSDYSALTPEEQSRLLGLAEQLEKLYGLYIDDIAADIASRISAEPAAASYEEPEVSGDDQSTPQKTRISVPAFSAGTVAPDASAEEYRDARDAQRRAEIEKALAFISE